MNHGKQIDSTMHFKSAQISGMEISPNDMAQINKYALSPLSPEDIFAFKVSMAANEIDRDFEMFPRHTLSKLASLFVGKTVVKDHEHKSDNQIARIYATELVEGQPTRMTKAGEVFTELIAKCYMVKTSTNADLIAEIRAGIRKEVSLGCRIGKAVCSVCDTDNVKTYCVHFPGKEYDGESCYFSLEQPQDAYELSFVAIPAQQHAGTVKSYGKKPFHEEEMIVREKTIQNVREIQHVSKGADDDGSFSTEEQAVKEPAQQQGSEESTDQSEPEIANTAENDAIMTENAPKEPQNDSNTLENAPNKTFPAQKEQEKDSQDSDHEPTIGEGDSTNRETESTENRLTVNRISQDEDEPGSSEPSKDQDQAEEDAEADEKSADESIAAEKKQALSQLWEAAKRLMPAPTTEEQCHRIAELFLEFENRLTINQESQVSDQPATSSQETSGREEAEVTKKEAEKALKAKQAEARLRALGLALSLRKRD